MRTALNAGRTARSARVQLGPEMRRTRPAAEAEAQAAGDARFPAFALPAFRDGRSDDFLSHPTAPRWVLGRSAGMHQYRGLVCKAISVGTGCCRGSLKFGVNCWFESCLLCSRSFSDSYFISLQMRIAPLMIHIRSVAQSCSISAISYRSMLGSLCSSLLSSVVSSPSAS